MGFFADAAASWERLNARIWEPHPKQEEARRLSGQVFELLFGGAAGGGKSWYLRCYAVEYAIQHPGANIGMVRRALPQLKSTHRKGLNTLTAGFATANLTENTWTFTNGSVIRFISLYNLGDEEAYKSVEFDLLLFDEVTELAESQYTYMTSRVRSELGYRAHVVATANPEGRGFRWVKRRWVSPLDEDLGPGQDRPTPGVPWTPMLIENGKVVDVRPSRAFLPSRISDNPTLERNNPNYRSQLRALGTRLSRALLDGDWDAMEETPGALWRQDQIDEYRVATHPTLVRVVIGVDPSGTDAKGADECGIVAAGLGDDGDIYILKDVSGVVDPDVWAGRVAVLYDEVAADKVVAEVNFGAKMVTSVLRHAAPNLPVRTVTASRGKAVRAEPVAWLAANGRIHHVGRLPHLEDELTTWTQDSGWSPGRVDGLVWSVTELTNGGQGQAWLEYLRQKAAELTQDDGEVPISA